MGFNGARKHQKIEDPYFYYYADKLGYLVWAEIPSPYNFNHHEVKYMNDLIQNVVKQLYNHPSIITWVPFNESWGVRKALTDFKQKSLVKSSYYLIKCLRSLAKDLDLDVTQEYLTSMIRGDLRTVSSSHQILKNYLDFFKIINKL